MPLLRPTHSAARSDLTIHYTQTDADQDPEVGGSQAAAPDFAVECEGLVGECLARSGRLSLAPAPSSLLPAMAYESLRLDSPSRTVALPHDSALNYEWLPEVVCCCCFQAKANVCSGQAELACIRLASESWQTRHGLSEQREISVGCCSIKVVVWSRLVWRPPKTSVQATSGQGQKQAAKPSPSSLAPLASFSTEATGKGDSASAHRRSQSWRKGLITRVWT